MAYLRYVTTPRPPGSDPWAAVHKNYNCKVLLPVLEKTFSPPATSAQWKEYFVTVTQHSMKATVTKTRLECG